MWTPQKNQPNSNLEESPSNYKDKLLSSIEKRAKRDRCYNNTESKNIEA